MSNRSHWGTPGGYQYGQSQEEHPADRERGERYWRSLGKRIRHGAAVRIPTR